MGWGIGGRSPTINFFLDKWSKELEGVARLNINYDKQIKKTKKYSYYILIYLYSLRCKSPVNVQQTTKYNK
jgi:hypothetical protein